MYYTKITSDEDVIATNTTDLLSSAVNFANMISSKGDTVKIYGATTDTSRSVLDR